MHDSALRRPSKPLSALVGQVPNAAVVRGDSGVEVSGICFDSRVAGPGDLYVAIPGERHDGRSFAADAVAKGAVAVASEHPLPPLDVTLVQVPSARPALAYFASAFFDHPSSRLGLIGVTGTDGKTTTTRLCGALLEAQGLKTGWLSTVDLKVGSSVRSNDYNHTTPEALQVQELLAEMVDHGVGYAALEASSHALAMDRLLGCRFDVAVFTNLSPEHLNFHGSFEAYLEAKAHLFRVEGLSHAVLNADDPSSKQIAEGTPGRIVTYGLDAPCDYLATDLELATGQTSFTLRSTLDPNGVRVTTRFVGRFNVCNWLAAIAATAPFGVGTEAIGLAARATSPPRGRMEEVQCGQPFRVIVDFSHTPEALATALDTLRRQTGGRLIAVFGQAGERYVANRARMGEVAAGRADFFVLTMDDPLFEDPAEIAEQIAAGARQKGRRRGVDFEIEIDRRKAIELAFAHARAGDTVLLAGKGHEQRMLVGDRREPWSDQQVAREVIGKGLGGPPDP